MNSFGEAIGLSARRFVAFTSAVAVVGRLTSAISQATREAIKFEREFVTLAQVFDTDVRSLRGLQNSLSDVSKEFGLSATVVAKTSVVLAQSGLSAKQTEQAMKTLAKTTLAATFDSIASSTEGAVAIMNQFGTEASQLEQQLGAINAVSKKFAVESGDIIEAVRRAGGAFRAAGGNLNDFIGLFTAVRSTTRESAETIATGFRTIFARIQRPKTIEFFKQLNIELTDGRGNFIGAFEAIKRLSQGLQDAGIKAGSLRFAEVVEQLGGIRQVSRVIPLLQQFTKAEEARQVAVAGGGSLDKDAAKAQETLSQAFARTTENFRALIREISQTATFQAIVKIALDLANAFIEVARALKPLIPLIAIFGGIKLGGVFGSAIRKGFGGAGGTGGLGQGFKRGGPVPGTGNGDTVPAMLEPGEFVIRKSAVQAFGADRLSKINKYASGGNIANRDVTKTFKRKIVSDQDEAYADGRLINENDNFSFKGALSPKRQTYGNRRIANLIKKSYTNQAQRNLSLKRFFGSNDQKGEEFENLLVKAGNVGQKIPGANSPLDFKSGKTYGEAKNTVDRVKDEIIFSKTIRQMINDGKYSSLIQNPSQADEKNISLPSVTLHEVSRLDESVIKRLISPLRTKRAGLAAGGSISGTDTVPALLTPGEFVINKKSAEAFGYGNLGKINKYAKGGPVGVQKFTNGGEVRDIVKNLLAAFNAELKGNIETSSSGKKRVSKDADLSETGSLAKKARGKLHPDRIAQSSDVNKELADQAFKVADDIKTYSAALKDSTKSAKETKKAQKGLAEAHQKLKEVNENLAESTAKTLSAREKAQIRSKEIESAEGLSRQQTMGPKEFAQSTVFDGGEGRVSRSRRDEAQAKAKDAKAKQFMEAAAARARAKAMPKTYPIATIPKPKPEPAVHVPKTYPIATIPKDDGKPKCIDLCAKTINALIKGFSQAVKGNVGGGAGGPANRNQKLLPDKSQSQTNENKTSKSKKGSTAVGLGVTAVALQGLASNASEVTGLLGIQSDALDQTISKLLTFASVITTVQSLMSTQLGGKLFGGLGKKFSNIAAPSVAKKGRELRGTLTTNVGDFFKSKGAKDAAKAARAAEVASKRAATKVALPKGQSIPDAIRAQGAFKGVPKVDAKQAKGIGKGISEGIKASRKGLIKVLSSSGAQMGLGIVKAMGPQIALLGIEFGLKAAGVIKDVGVKKEEAIERGDVKEAVDLTTTEQGQSLLNAMVLAGGALTLFTGPIGLAVAGAGLLGRVLYDNADSLGGFGEGFKGMVDSAVDWVDGITGWATEARQAAKSAALLNKAQKSTTQALESYDRILKLGGPNAQSRALGSLETAAASTQASLDFENRAIDFTNQSEALGTFASTMSTGGLNLVAGELFGSEYANPMGQIQSMIGLGDTAQERDSVLNAVTFGVLGTDIAGQEEQQAKAAEAARQEESKIARKVIDTGALTEQVQAVIDSGGGFEDFTDQLQRDSPHLFNLLNKTGELSDAFEITKQKALEINFENFKSASQALLAVSKGKFDRDSQIRALTGGTTGRKEFDDFTKEQSGIINFGLNNLQGGAGGGANAFGADVSTTEGLKALISSTQETAAAIEVMRSGATAFSETLEVDLNGNGQAVAITLGQAEELQKKQNLAIQQSLPLAKQRLQVIQQEIQARNANIKTLNNFVTDFAFSSGKDKRQQTQQFASAQRVAAGLRDGKTVGEIQGVSQADKQASKALFEQFGDVAIFGGKTGKEVLGDARVAEFGGEQAILGQYGDEQGQKIIKALREGTVSESDKMIKEMSDLNKAINEAEKENVMLFNEGAKLFADSVMLQASFDDQKRKTKKLSEEQEELKKTGLPAAVSKLQEAEAEARDTLLGKEAADRTLEKARKGEIDPRFSSLQEVEAHAALKTSQHEDQLKRVRDAEAAKNAAVDRGKAIETEKQELDKGVEDQAEAVKRRRNNMPSGNNQLPGNEGVELTEEQKRRIGVTGATAAAEKEGDLDIQLEIAKTNERAAQTNLKAAESAPQNAAGQLNIAITGLENLGAMNEAGLGALLEKVQQAHDEKVRENNRMQEQGINPTVAGEAVPLGSTSSAN